MHGGMIDHVLHLVDQRHRARITAEQLESQLAGERRFVQLRNILRAFVDELGPTIFQREEIVARVGGPACPCLSLRLRIPVPTLQPNPFSARHVNQSSKD